MSDELSPEWFANWLTDGDDDADNTPNTITVKLAGGKHFSKALRYAKRWGGRYNSADKTWTIETERMGNAANNPRIYGLIPVSNASHKHDGTCPARWGGACECQ